MRLTGTVTGNATTDAFISQKTMHRTGGSLSQKLARIVLGLLLVIAPWLFGSVEDWSWGVLQCLTLLAVVLAVCSGEATWDWWWGGVVVALAVYMAIQALNPTHRCDPMDGSLIPLTHLAWLPHSVDAATTWRTLLKLLSYAGLYWAVRISFTERRYVWALFTALAISGFLLAVVGLMQKLSGTDLMLGLRKGGFFFFGPFVNRNNYAAYINLLIPSALAIMNHRRHVAQAEGARSHPGGLFTFMALVMILSVVLTTSRAGTVVCAGVLLAWGAIEIAHIVRAGGQARQMLFVVVLAAAALIAGLLYLGTKPVEERLSQMSEVPAELAASGGRGTVYKATLKMFGDNWLYGIGAGTFALTYPYYSTERMDWFRRYAHNDWLQYLAELGVIGTTLLIALGVTAFRERGKRKEKNSPSGRMDWLTISLLIGLVGVGLHALVDFPLHIPAVAVLVVGWSSLLTGPRLRRHYGNH